MEAQGKIEVMKKDRKGFKMDDGQWYSNNFKPELNVKVGDTVNVNYTVNGQYYNYDTVEVTESAPAEAKQAETKTIGVLTSYAKDLIVAAIGNSQMPKVELKMLMKESAEAVIEAYKQIEKSIYDSEPEFAAPVVETKKE